MLIYFNKKNNNNIRILLLYFYIYVLNYVTDNELEIKASFLESKTPFSGKP